MKGEGDMREIDEIIIHCSDSSFGNAALIDSWHREKGWDCIGYHYVILNGFVDLQHYDEMMDGHTDSGRPIWKEGAHCLGKNATSIGLCLIGMGGVFTSSQLQALKRAIGNLKKQYGDINVSFHSDYNKDKPLCPGITARDLLNV